MKNRDNGQCIIDPPTFSPPPDMRSGYIDRRKNELDQMLDQARAGEWKPVMLIVNHVRGTGAMYGFENIGKAAEDVVKAVQNGDAKSLEFLEEYVKTVRDSYV